jgi:hypothetical protein
LVVDTSVDVREAVVGELSGAGHQAIATNSVAVACALVQAGLVDVLFLNVSAFPREALRRLGHALSARPQVKLFAMAILVSAEAIVDPLGPPAHGRVGPPAAGALGSRWLHLQSAETLSLGPRRVLPN